MEEREFVGALRAILEKEREIYKECLLLAEQTEDLELKEILGHHAYEEFTHLNALMEKYQALVDDMLEKGGPLMPPPRGWGAPF